MLRKHAFAFLTHVDTDILLRLERHDCTHATVLAKAQKRQAPPAVPEKVIFLTTWADVRQSETAGTVPDGLLVFFPSYGVLQSCVDHWKNTSASGAPRLQCVPIDPGASVVGAFAVACPCAPGALPREQYLGAGGVYAGLSDMRRRHRRRQHLRPHPALQGGSGAASGSRSKVLLCVDQFPRI